jgi:hypothetical protein
MRLQVFLQLCAGSAAGLEPTTVMIVIAMLSSEGLWPLAEEAFLCAYGRGNVLEVRTLHLPLHLPLSLRLHARV